MLPVNKSSKTVSDLNLFFFILFLTFFLGKTLVSQNYTQLLILLLPLLALIVWKSTLWALMLISLIIFFGDWLISMNIVPVQFMWGQELLALIIFFKGITNKFLQKRKIDFVGGLAITGLLAVSLVSVCINKSEVITFVLFLRLLIRYYLLFLGLVNLDMEEKEIKTFNNLLLFLVAIQIPVSIIKYSIYGQSESAIGTYSGFGGVPSTVLPLIVIGFSISYYLLYKKSFIFVLLILGFIAFSIVGAKRGFIFYFLILIIFLSWYLKNDIKRLFRYVLVAGVIFFIALYSTLTFVPSLSPEKQHRTGFYPLYALNFARQYTTGEMEGVSYGRISSNINVIKNLAKRGLIIFLFGKGPGNVMKTRFGDFDTRERARQEFNIGYGITGLSWLAMNVGYLGVLTYFFLLFLLMKRCLLFYKMEKDPYWRSFGLGMVAFSFTMIIISLTYANILTTDLISMHYFCLNSFIILRMRKYYLIRGKISSC